MALIDQISESIKDAMRSKEKEKLEALRSIKAALMLEATKGGDGIITEQAEMQILNKLYKQRKESSTIFRQQGRADLAEPEDFQAGIIEAYLPKQLSEAEIETVVKAIIAKVGATGPSDMGKVMGAASGQLAGKADGKLISEIVKRNLAT